MTVGDAAVSIQTFVRRHPWLIASLTAHALLAAGLYEAGRMRIEQHQRKAAQVQVDASMRETAQREMRRELRRMEEIRDALEESAGLPPRDGTRDKSPDAADPARRAQEIAQQIEQVRQHIRAAEMARVLHIPEEEARRRVQAEVASQPAPVAPKASTPEATVEQLSKEARKALQERRAQLKAQRDGIVLSPENTQAGERIGFGKGKGDGKGIDLGKSQGDGGPSLGTGVQASRPGVLATGVRGDRLDVLATGLEVDSPKVIIGRSLDMSDDGQRAFYRPPPQVDAVHLRPGSGQVIGASGTAANRVFLDTWWVIGPFEGHGGASQQFVYPPERGVDLDAVYYGKDGQLVRWTWQQQTVYPMVPRQHAEKAVYYAYTEVSVDRDMDLWVWIGADDDSKMWFNDSAVWISEQTGEKNWYHQAFTSLYGDLSTMNLTEGQRRLHFRKGRNTILFKLYNNLGLMFYSVVLSRG
jgi:hypothetical protein